MRDSHHIPTSLNHGFYPQFLAVKSCFLYIFYNFFTWSGKESWKLYRLGFFPLPVREKTQHTSLGKGDIS